MNYFWGVPKYWGALAAAQSAPLSSAHECGWPDEILKGYKYWLGHNIMQLKIGSNRKSSTILKYIHSVFNPFPIKDSVSYQQNKCCNSWTMYCILVHIQPLIN